MPINVSAIHPQAKAEDFFPNNKILSDETIQLLRTKLIDEELSELEEAKSDVTDRRFSRKTLKDKYNIDIDRGGIIRVKDAASGKYHLYATYRSLRFRHKNEFNLERFSLQLGSGGFGKVCLSQNLDTGEWKALKIFYSSSFSFDDIQREATFVGLLKEGHSQVITKVIERNGILFKKNYLLLNYHSGKDLRYYCDDKQKKFEAKTFFKIIFGMINEIKNIHTYQLIHCDINLNNFIYNADKETIKLIDFGFMQTLAEGITEPRGTPRFVAPETQYGLYSYASDIYALGVVIQSLLQVTKINQEIFYSIRNFTNKICSYKAEERPDLKKIEEEFEKYYKKLFSLSANHNSLFAKTQMENIEHVDTVELSLRTCDFATL